MKYNNIMEALESGNKVTCERLESLFGEQFYIFLDKSENICDSKCFVYEDFETFIKRNNFKARTLLRTWHDCKGIKKETDIPLSVNVTINVNVNENDNISITCEQIAYKLKEELLKHKILS